MNTSGLLWRAVLGQAIRDTYEGQQSVRAEVIRWLKTKDFEAVCDFACVEKEQMQLQIATLLTLPIPLAKKYGRMLRMRVMEGVHNQEGQRSD